VKNEISIGLCSARGVSVFLNIGLAHSLCTLTNEVSPLLVSQASNIKIQKIINKKTR
jgi:hypothetical protein